MTFKIFGCKITVSFLFTALIALLLLFDRSSIFVLTLISVIIHESGHLIMMKLLNQVPDAIKVIPAGVIITKNKICSYRDEILISSGGIFFNVIITAVFSVLYRFHISENFSLSVAMVNLFIAFFNMLPVNGLDGYEIIKNITRCKSHRMTVVSVVTLVLLLIFGVVLFYWYFNPTLMITSVYLIILTILNFKR
ncbi:MAG: hypothetical protein BGN88_12200 [Clostridiales bacterium 43-6]|nr:MAG: hypothetical protein BGN88_12200 [Clostridiales bacterium 43-6]